VRTEARSEVGSEDGGEGGTVGGDLSQIISIFWIPKVHNIVKDHDA
jgi:hypothetical protein